MIKKTKSNSGHASVKERLFGTGKELTGCWACRHIESCFFMKITIRMLENN